MIAEQIMSDVVPALKLKDYCNTALSWMEVFKISHLPVVENQIYKGLISDNMIYDANIFDNPVGDLNSKFIPAKVAPNRHFFEIIDIFSKLLLLVWGKALEGLMQFGILFKQLL